MKKPSVYITKQIPKEAEDYIGKFCNYEKWESERDITREELFQKIRDVDGLLQSGIKIDEELLNHAPNLKVVSNISVGYNNFYIDAMKKRGVIGTNTPDVLDDTVADLIMGLMLCSSRRIAELDAYVKAGKWQSNDDISLFGIDVHHSTLGIIGMGRIGETLAKRAKLGFDMDVLYYNRSRKVEAENRLGVQYSELDSLLNKSDFIVVMTPLTKETRKLIGAREFNLMKETAVFINASRGPVVNEKDLIEALKNKRIYGAGLDVYEKEPIEADNPLLKLNNAITLPHIGSATKKTRFKMAMLAAENLVKALTGETPPNIVPELK